MSCVALAGFPVLAADPEPIRATDKPLTKEEARFRALDSDNDRRLSDQELRADDTSQTGVHDVGQGWRWLSQHGGVRRSTDPASEGADEVK